MHFLGITVFSPDQLVTSCLFIFEPAEGAASRLAGRLGRAKGRAGVDDQVLGLLRGGNLGTLAASLKEIGARPTLESACCC